MNLRCTLVGCGLGLGMLLWPGLAWSQTAPATTSPTGGEAAAANTPLGCLSALLKDADPQRVRVALVALRSTEDKAILPLFVALSRGSDDGRRYRATVALSEMAGKDAVPCLLERLHLDTEMAVRASALVELLRLDAIDCKELAAQLKVPDKGVQGVAARALVSKSRQQTNAGDVGTGVAASSAPAATSGPQGQDGPATHGRDAHATTAPTTSPTSAPADMPSPRQLALAREILTDLAKSDDPAAAGMARLSLLSLGDGAQFDALKAVMNDPTTPSEVQALLVSEIGNQKISAAVPLAQAVLDSASTIQMRQMAYRALLANDPGAGKAIVQEIRKSDQTVARVALLRTLMLSTEGAKLAPELTEGDDAVAALARMEVARAAIADCGFSKELGQTAATAAGKAMAAGHPIVIDYVLWRVKMDVGTLKDRADFYVPALAAFAKSVTPSPDHLGDEHIRAAEACTDLADIGTPAAMDALKELMGGKYSAVVRCAASGLLRTANAKACDLARPLLASPHSELSNVAMLVMGRFGDRAATDSLQKILDESQRHSPALLALCSWYLARINNTTAELGKTLAEEVK